MRGAALQSARRLAVVLLLPLASCASYQARPIDPATTAKALDRRSLSDPRLLRFIAIERHRAQPPRWDLDTLTLVATYERPDMPLATAKLGVANAGEITAAELPNPRLAIAPTYNATTTTPSPWKVGPVITFLIQSFGARPARIAQAKAQAEAARQALAVTAWQLRGQVRAALIALWSARRAAALSGQRLAYAQQYRIAVAQRYRAGMVSAAALTAATLAENRAALQVAASERTLRLARTKLAAALGLPPGALHGIKLDMAGLSHPRHPGDLEPLIHAALTSRPDVLAALARYAAAEAGLRRAVAQQYPSIDIGPGYHYDQGDNKYILAVSLPLPILNQNQGPIAVARAKRRVAAEQFLATQSGVLAEIDHAQTNWRASDVELGQARNVRTAAAHALARQRSAFAAGQIGRLRLLGAKLAYVQAEQGALAASVHERVALGELEAALYHPFLVASRSQ